MKQKVANGLMFFILIIIALMLTYKLANAGSLRDPLVEPPIYTTDTPEIFGLDPLIQCDGRTIICEEEEKPRVNKPTPEVEHEDDDYKPHHHDDEDEEIEEEHHDDEHHVEEEDI